MIPEISSPDTSLLASLVCRTMWHCESVTSSVLFIHSVAIVKMNTPVLIYFQVLSDKIVWNSFNSKFYKPSVCHILNFWNIDQTISCKEFPKGPISQAWQNHPVHLYILCKCSSRDGFNIAPEIPVIWLSCQFLKVFLQPQAQARPSQML